MCKELKAIAKPTIGGQGRAPAKLQVQDRAVAGEQATATVQADSVRRVVRVVRAVRQVVRVVQRVVRVVRRIVRDVQRVVRVVRRVVRVVRVVR